ncbi:MAG: hypothetical protein QXG97_00740 [Nitrososphaerota archaeon]
MSKLIEEVASGKYDGYIIQAANKLTKSLPPGNRDKKEILDEVRTYALEAASWYDSRYEVKFTTFLYKHLQIRCMQYKNYSWLRSRYPRGKYVMNETDLGVDICNWASRRDMKTLTKLQIQELIEYLSDDAREVFVQLLECLDEDIERNLRYRRYSKVSVATGVSEMRISLMCDELKVKAMVLCDV